jgi:hypothetical protein
MKRMAGLTAVLLSAALGAMALAGCDTGTNPETHNTQDNFKGKKWQSGPSAMNMWNVWDFGNDGTFEFTHYHNADTPDPRGTYSYRVEDGKLFVTPPGGTETYYVFDFAANGKSFTLDPVPGGGNNTYTLDTPGQ